MLQRILSLIKQGFLFYLASVSLLIGLIFLIFFAILLTVFSVLMLSFPFVVSVVLTVAFFVVCICITLYMFNDIESAERQEECSDE